MVASIRWRYVAPAASDLRCMTRGSGFGCRPAGDLPSHWVLETAGPHGRQSSDVVSVAARWPDRHSSCDPGAVPPGTVRSERGGERGLASPVAGRPARHRAAGGDRRWCARRARGDPPQHHRLRRRVAGGQPVVAAGHPTVERAGAPDLGGHVLPVRRVPGVHARLDVRQPSRRPGHGRWRPALAARGVRRAAGLCVPVGAVRRAGEPALGPPDPRRGTRRRR